MSYFDTILQDDSGPSSGKVRQLLPADPAFDPASGPGYASASIIPYPKTVDKAKGYIKLHDLRTALGIPAEGLNIEQISREYPDWPIDRYGHSPDASWAALMVYFAQPPTACSGYVDLII
ncbi:hypothetical protein TWF106_006471 [Orbilia oligospora]|uniref:Uncharacterized protein n=1 Tax=Orbilia oligospora TaxID=2813651 RepID=A0A7C8QQH5_ORBOL|nr:hypothetical protein TWF106_006471 [Orbilia oligospora]